MMETIFTWLMAFFALMALLVLVVYQLMCLADLEYDYINPYDSSSRINFVILPEFILQGFLCLLFLLSGHWFMFLLCVPYLYHNITQYQRRRYLIEVTEIFNVLNKEKKIRMIKLGHCFTLLFISLFWLIYNIVEDNEY